MNGDWFNGGANLNSENRFPAFRDHADVKSNSTKSGVDIAAGQAPDSGALICAATHQACLPMSDHSTDGHSTGAPAAMLLSPLEKLKEQGFPLLIAGAPTGT